ncbi:hypothetical protein ACQP2P_16010 [Dactylosporangium sp. CA-139114]|uniref:magnesium chelatase subunit ChlI family protein n=1 Tax=Dactylosporangium sp. CA-139114 TaxID=3239931 RepID=UPI003D96AEAD
MRIAAVRPTGRTAALAGRAAARSAAARAATTARLGHTPSSIHDQGHHHDHERWRAVPRRPAHHHRMGRHLAAAAARWAECSAATGAEVTNHNVPDGVVRRSAARLTPAGRALLHAALDTGTVTVRTATRIVRLAWTIADLAGHDHPDRDDIAEAAALAMPEHG